MEMVIWISIQVHLAHLRQSRRKGKNINSNKEYEAFKGCFQVGKMH
jgi:hypothetical protein